VNVSSKVASIEGNRLRLDGGAMFGNVPKELWKKWHTPDEFNRIGLATRSLLLEKAGQKILFDVGVGNFFSKKLKERFGIDEVEHRLIQNLEERGIAEEEIDAVVLTHLHFDHAGGLLKEESRALHFPHAEIFVPKRHWEHALQPPRRERASFLPELHTLLEKSGRLHLVEDALPFCDHFFSDGHTRGLLHPLIETDEGLVAMPSDLLPGPAWLGSAIAMGYDRYPELTTREKEAFLERASQEKMTLYFSHDPEWTFARVEKKEGKFSLC